MLTPILFSLAASLFAAATPRLSHARFRHAAVSFRFDAAFADAARVRRQRVVYARRLLRRRHAMPVLMPLSFS